MPNLDFYAVGGDFNAVLDYIFMRSGCRVFESGSAFDKELIEFFGVDEVIAKLPVGVCKGDGPGTRLALVVPSATALFRIRRHTLNPDRFDGHRFAYTIEGWGLIWLDLGGVGPRGIVVSHSNHNSQTRARKWEQIGADDVAADAGDWAEVYRVSAALNRFVRGKLAVGKLAARPVLAAADAALRSGSEPADAFGRFVVASYRQSRD